MSFLSNIVKDGKNSAVKLNGMFWQTRKAVWGDFKESLSIKGYGYYEPPAEVKYRYPAPGSAAQDVTDRWYLYKPDWKLPYRASAYNIQKIPLTYDAGDWKQASHVINIDVDLEEEAKHPLKGATARALLAHTQPRWKNNQTTTSSVALEDSSSSTASPTTQKFNVRHTTPAAIHDYLQRQLAMQPVTQMIYDEEHVAEGSGNHNAVAYDVAHIDWRPRGVTGFESNSDMKNVFVGIEHLAEEGYFKKRVEDGYVAAIKGSPKKWQILDDDCFDRDQIAKLQAACDAPMPEQLDAWKVKHTGVIQAPYTNENVAKWRDDPAAIDCAMDFNPRQIQAEREQNQKFFQQTYSSPRQLTQA